MSDFASLHVKLVQGLTLESKARCTGVSGSDGSGTNAVEDREEGAGAKIDDAEEEDPSRESGSLYQALADKARLPTAPRMLLTTRLGVVCCR